MARRVMVWASPSQAGDRGKELCTFDCGLSLQLQSRRWAHAAVVGDEKGKYLWMR